MATYNDGTMNGGQSDWLTIAQSAYSESTTYFNSGIRLEIESAIRQAQGQHPQGSKYHSEAYRAKSRFFRPKTRSAIRRGEAVAAAALFSNSDVVEVVPWDESDDTQRQSAMLHKELINLRLKRTIPWFLLSVGAYQDATTVGLCCSYQYWCYNEKKKKDEPAVRLVPIENLRFDPSASWTDIVGTTPYLIEMMPMYVKDVKARMRYGEKGEAKWMAATDEEILVAVKSYSDSIRLQREHGRADSQAQASSLNGYQLVWVHRNIAEIDGDDYMWYTLGTTKLLTAGKRLDAQHWHGMRPYVIGYAVIETHKAYPPGVPGLTKDIQGELNENANQRMDNVKLAMNKRYFAKRGAQVDLRSLTRSTAGGVTLMNDPKFDVIVQETKDVTSSAYEEQNRLNADFDEMTGTFTKPGTNDSSDLANKVGGAELLTEDKNLLESYQLRTWVMTWVIPVLYQLMKLEMHYETDPNILTLCGKKASAANGNKPIRIDDNMLMQELSLECNVGIGATSPQKQLSLFLWAMQTIVNILKDGVLDKYGLEPDEVINEVFAKIGYRDASRFFDWDTTDPRISALQAQVQDLQDAVNKKEPPEIIAAKVALLQAQVKKVDAERVKTGVEASFGAMEAGEVVAAVPGVAPVADAIMKAAGYTPPNPPGVDPGLDAGAPSQADPGLSVEAVKNKRTGIDFMPGSAAEQPGFNPVAAGRNLPPGIPESTHPLQPKMPDSATAGANQGISSVAQLRH